MRSSLEVDRDRPSRFVWKWDATEETQRLAGDPGELVLVATG
jgi:hypothetical protein